MRSNFFVGITGLQRKAKNRTAFSKFDELWLNQSLSTDGLEPKLGASWLEEREAATRQSRNVTVAVLFMMIVVFIYFLG